MLREFSLAPRTMPFIDYLRFTVPQHQREQTLQALEPYTRELGALYDYNCYRSPSGGTVTVKDHYAVTSVSLTGRYLHELREHGLFPQFLVDVALLPSYRLTQAHFTLDVSFEGADYIPWFYEAARRKEIRLSRKFDVLKDLQWIHSVPFRCPEKSTGTVYLGSPKAERRLKAYDKAQERFARVSEMPPPTTRLEVQLSDKTGITLRDVAMPLECFYHFVPASAIEPPEGLQGWKPTEAIGGYAVERKTPPTPYHRATILLQSIEPVLKSIRKLSLENPERSEAFTELILSRVTRTLKGAA